MRQFSWSATHKPVAYYCESCADDIRNELSIEGAIPEGLVEDELVEYHGPDLHYPWGPYPGDGTKCAGCGVVMVREPGDDLPYPGSKTDAAKC